MTQLQDDLDAIIVLLDSPKKWTRIYFAKDASGNRCDPQSVHAVCWCIGGAILAVCGESKIVSNNQEVNSRTLNVCREIRKYIPKDVTIDKWNDTPGRTFDDVRHVLNAALNGSP
jgi:hypothetical protein